jgi:hypothetical protein
MIAAPTTVLRTLAFGDLESGSWGVIWTPEGSERVAIVDGARPEGIELEFEPLNEWTIAYSSAEGDDQSDDDANRMTVRTGRVSGRLTTAAVTEPLDLPGLELKCNVPALTELDSLRQVLAWFADDDALAVSAGRPRKAAGHDRDEVLAAMIEPDGALAIDEARLSTTYASGGPASKMSLELWPADEEDNYPRRAAGEASQPPTEARAGGALLEIHPMRCHRAGRDGAGVYLIARAHGEGAR